MSRLAAAAAANADAAAAAARELLIADLEDKVIAMATGAEPTPWKTTVEKTDFVRAIYHIMEDCYCGADSTVFNRKQRKQIGRLHSDEWSRFVLHVFQYMKTKGYLDGDNTEWEDTAGGSDEVIQEYMVEALETYM
jgi:hypothetical protein